MGKLLRVLVVFFLIFSIGALALGILLFGKRELLKGRTRKLEDTIIALGTTVEEEAAKEGPKADYPARDVSPVTAEAIDTPELSKFWDTYAGHLEAQDMGRMNINARRTDLMMLYKRDPATQKIERDERGYKMMTGPGTMQGLLDELVENAQNQYNRLNETRLQLKNTREELISTIQELNRQKQGHRKSLAEVERLNAEIDRLKAEVRRLETRIEELQEEKDRLEGEVKELRRQMAFLNEEIERKDLEITELKDEIKKREVGQQTTPVQWQKGPLPPVVSGEKGKVFSVNPEWGFVVIQLSDSFLQEIQSGEQPGAVAGMELLVRRKGEGGKPDQFVTKIRMVSIRPDEKLGLADIMPQWQQMPMAKGDVVFHE